MKTIIVAVCLLIAMFAVGGATYFAAMPFFWFGVTPIAFVVAGAVTGPLAFIGLALLWLAAKNWAES